MDNETKAIKTEAQHLEALMQSDGYQIAKSKLIQRLQSIIDINSLDLDNMTPEQIAIQIKANKMASLMVLEWIQVDIEGTVSQAKTNLGGFTLNREELIIRRED